MKRILKTYIPSACITFTLTVLFNGISNMLQGHIATYYYWVLQMFAFIIVIDVIDFAFGYINFKTYCSYFVTEMIVTYGAMLLFGYFCHWFSFTIRNLLLMSIIFFAVYACVHSYFYKMAHIQADEINRLIAK